MFPIIEQREQCNWSHARVRIWLFVALLCCLGGRSFADDIISFDNLAVQFSQETRPLLTRHCLGCHSTAKMEGELDLERFAALADVRRSPRAWQKVAEMLDNGEMPPKKARQPSADERKQLRGWVKRYLDAEAHASAGDPGPVVLRRLSNAEYTYTVRDLIGVDLQPARDFPVDGAAGEGFTNTGAALVMSPALLTKYLDAGKEIARHAVLLPDGIRFSTGATRRDWTNEILAEIKAFYARFADADGRLPLENYLAATLARPGETSDRGLNSRYLTTLKLALTGNEPSPLLDPIRASWRSAKSGDVAKVTARIARWQQALSRFQSVGHMKPWVVPVDPVATGREIRLKIPTATVGREVMLYLAAGDAGDGNANDFVVWQRPRLVTPGRPDLLLRDVRDFVREMGARRGRIFSSTAKCLMAAAEASGGAWGRTASVRPQNLGARSARPKPPVANEAVGSRAISDVAALARRHQVDADALAAWLDYLGIGGRGAPLHLDYFKERITRSANYDFIQGWGTRETPLLIANSSDQHVRVPGNMKPHGVAVHPSPTLFAAIGWRSPIAGTIDVRATVTHAHPECGNGVEWLLELRRGATRQRLAAGTAAGAKSIDVGPVTHLAVEIGDLVSLLIGPRDGNHACDLTDVEFVLKGTGKEGVEWNLTRDVSANILAGNPHADRFGREGVWHFYTQPVQGNAQGPLIPSGSLLARWQSAERADQKQSLAQEVQKLLINGPPADQNDPDAQLYRQLASLGGPLFAGARSTSVGPRATNRNSNQSPGTIQPGVDPALFGRHPRGAAVDPADLCVQAPSLIEIHLPADLVAGSELAATAVLHRDAGAEGSVQVWASTSKPDSLTELRSDTPVLVGPGGAARRRFNKTFEDFRRLFPAALCYNRIVPVDEAVTLTLYHREDEPLCRLMLYAPQQAKLDWLWSELHFVSQDALTQVDAFAQLMEYATQDSDPRLFEPYRKPINERAAAFRKLLVDTEPVHLDSLLALAARAYRHPLTDAQTRELRGLYRNLRSQGLSHDEAFRLTLARVFVSPAFLYHLEKAAPGTESTPVSNWELASRLSYFLWSSIPDEEPSEAAASGRLTDPDVLVAQTRRMLGDPRIRRLATEFACQWLHIRDFDSLNEKSERQFPTFVTLRGDMYEESIRFLTDLFQRDASVLELLDSDSTFLNEALAKHYGIPGVTGPQWRFVTGIRKYSRGGILGLATTLAKQSGASRSSPTLRGNWVAEVLLGDKLPRPPKDVPRLPDEETAIQGLTVRQLVEKHASDARCAACHVRIDPFGFALEEFDAIGRRRTKDLGDRAIDVHVKLRDGTEFDGIDGLRNYLLTTQRDAVLKQFCRKLLGYALGRGMQLSDAPLLAKMQEQLQKNEYRVSAAIEAIVRSRQFRQIRGRDVPTDDGP
jgi:hypothetical protein